ncbi:MAG: 4-hydroxythreonine-4-phosphate dehydrogenase PdxA [Bacillota bacterium]|nr:4-hydroxythreonine-4-phosphate dehydrogenase PdxA [Bacillota bacterium]
MSRDCKDVTSKPVLLVTMGDPAGIGPEICVKALGHPAIRKVCKPVIIGIPQVLAWYAGMLRPGLAVTAISSPAEASGGPEALEVILAGDGAFDLAATGTVSPGAGHAAYSALAAAIVLVQSGEADAIVTCPLNKEALVSSGSPYIDHTEALAALTHTSPLTMFEVRQLRIFFATRHVSLEQSINLLDKETVLKTITGASLNMRRLGFPAPRLAVAALNPHAGEGGLFGRQEIEVLAPAIAEAKNRGVNVTGPVPADSVFAQGLKGRYDAVISLYHDQGHIAAKTYDFERTVSVTLGLPFIRTSVDHGTAFDIAGKGVASEVSLVEAMKSAVRYAQVYRRNYQIMTAQASPADPRLPATRDEES